MRTSRSKVRQSATRDTLLSCVWIAQRKLFSGDRTWRHWNTWLLIVRDVSTTLSRRKRCHIYVHRDKITDRAQLGMHGPLLVITQETLFVEKRLISISNDKWLIMIAHADDWAIQLFLIVLSRLDIEVLLKGDSLLRKA